MIGIIGRPPSPILRIALAGLLGLALAGCDDEPAASDAAIPDGAQPPDSRPQPDADTTDADTTDADTTDGFLQPQGATCADPIVILPGDSDENDTSDLLDAVTAPCSPGSATAEDAIYSVAIGEAARDLLAVVTVDEEAEPPFDVVFHARSDCGDADTNLACSDVGWGERLELLEVSGTVTLIVDGTSQYGGSRSGAYTLTTAARDVVAISGSCDPAGVSNRCESGARCVGTSCVSDSAELACSLAIADPDDVTATTYLFESNYYQGSCAHDEEAGFPERIYQLTLAATSDLTATTDFPATDFDTYLYLRSAAGSGNACSGAEVGCHDDVAVESHNLRSNLVVEDLPAGVYYLFVDGSSASPGTGTYQLQVTITPAG